MRAIPQRCEVVEGIPEPVAAIRLVYCESRPAYTFSLLGNLPLYVCERHLASSRKMFDYYSADIAISRLA